MLSQKDDKITSSYCANRWCLVCNAIRTARSFERYYPVAEAWRDRWYVTLTVRNVPASELPRTLRQMIKDFQEIKRAIHRTDGLELECVRKVECTYNRRTDEYHPHFHFLVKGEATARRLQQRWLDYHPDTTDPKGQDCRPCDAGTLRDLFKYFTKLCSKVKRGDKYVSIPIPIPALDIIFRAVRGLRVYQPVGFRVAKHLPDDEADDFTLEESTPALRRQRATWTWDQAVTDWVNVTTGECLTGYDPGAKFVRFVQSFSPPQVEMTAVLPSTVRLLDPTTSGECTVNIREALDDLRARVWLTRPRWDPVTVTKLAEQIANLFPVSRVRAAQLAREERRRLQFTLSLHEVSHDRS